MESENENKLPTSDTTYNAVGGKNKNVQTYTEDMVRAIETDKGGIIKKIIHEEELHEAEKKNFSPESRRNKTFMAVSLLLIFISLAFFLTFFKKDINTVIIAPQTKSIFFTDESVSKPIDGLTKDEIAKIVLNQVKNTKVKVGGVERIYLTENQKNIGLKDFISRIKGNLVFGDENFFNDGFLLGVFNEKGKSVQKDVVVSLSKGGDLFILLQVSSFTDAFPKMRAWENKMFDDLHEFFDVSISSETKYLLTKNFEDGIVLNKNSRILKDNDGKIVLMYVFLSDTSVIITKSEIATKEAINRLASSQVKK